MVSACRIMAFAILQSASALASPDRAAPPVGRFLVRLLEAVSSSWPDFLQGGARSRSPASGHRACAVCRDQGVGADQEGLTSRPAAPDRARDGCAGLGLIAAVVCAIPAMVVVVSVAEMAVGVGLVATSLVKASVIGDAS